MSNPNETEPSASAPKNPEPEQRSGGRATKLLQETRSLLDNERLVMTDAWASLEVITAGLTPEESEVAVGALAEALFLILNNPPQLAKAAKELAAKQYGMILVRRNEAVAGIRELEEALAAIAAAPTPAPGGLEE